MVASKQGSKAPLILGTGLVLGLGCLLWAFPPVRLVRLSDAPRAAAGQGASSMAVSFDAAAAARAFWDKALPAGCAKATALPALLQALHADPALARATHGRKAGLGDTYYFVEGTGRVVAREGNRARVAIEGHADLTVELRLGPVFGNTVRDGTGLLDVNQYPGLDEYNALSAELNTLVEKEVLPELRAKAQAGARITFVGCAPAPELAAPADSPALILIPVRARMLP